MHTRASAEPGWEGKPGLFPCSQIWWEVGMLCQHQLEILSPQRPYSVFWRCFSKHIGNAATPRMIPALQGELKRRSGAQTLQVRHKSPPEPKDLLKCTKIG